MASLWIALALVPVFLSILWTLSSTSTSALTRSFQLRNKRICLLIAHPDDEAMFFAPTLLALTKPELGNHVKILCLSSGDADGLGHVREDELRKSAIRLGLGEETDVFVVDDPRFPDSMTATWSAKDVCSALASAFAPELAQSLSPSLAGAASRRKSCQNDGDEPTIDVLLTFDQHGISNHPNHRSLYHGAVTFLRELTNGKSDYSCPVTLYTLTTTNIVRKYAGVLDAPFTILWSVSNIIEDSISGKTPPPKGGIANRLLFVSTFDEWMKAQMAMIKGHQSQMVWFRWGWITIGRYMVVNDLKREII
ncbi:hypothetical protein Egran_03642 [Elaphomyces granulatus]|uniref:N-acetylglucosaminylphosphatidylinositol deacetylase n=1 Tax=Elaphomyces granulatus TaxID=519963 RepID=A0A232LWY6_9EURO|nr:hypothetical protein Egran_03642 [Elaphomyces granulatus]